MIQLSTIYICLFCNCRDHAGFLKSSIEISPKSGIEIKFQSIRNNSGNDSSSEADTRTGMNLQKYVQDESLLAVKMQKIPGDVFNEEGVDEMGGEIDVREHVSKEMQNARGAKKKKRRPIMAQARSIEQYGVPVFLPKEHGAASEKLHPSHSRRSPSVAVKVTAIVAWVGLSLIVLESGCKEVRRRFQYVRLQQLQAHSEGMFL